MVENTFRMLANCFRCVLTTVAQEPHNVTSVSLACVTVHNIIWICYRADHQGLVDEEDNDHRDISDDWRQVEVLVYLGVGLTYRMGQ